MPIKMLVNVQESNFKRFLAIFCDFFVFANFDLRGNVTDCALTYQIRLVMKKISMRLNLP